MGRFRRNPSLHIIQIAVAVRRDETRGLRFAGEVSWAAARALVIEVLVLPTRPGPTRHDVDSSGDDLAAIPCHNLALSPIYGIVRTLV